MRTRKFLIAANWKMYAPPSDALQSRGTPNPYAPRSNIDVVIFPTFLHLESCMKAGLIVGAQYGHEQSQGAHTGDVSMKMLKEIGCHFVLCGHSERRANHQETNEKVAAQVISALECDLHPIICVGETWEERSQGKAKKIIEEQFSLLPLQSDLTIAYEPVWAISGGDTKKPAATPKDAQDMHAYIRSLLPKDRREATRILYGGSMKPENAQNLLELPDVDGGLIGGASLKSDAFQIIIQIASTLSSS